MRKFYFYFTLFFGGITIPDKATVYLHPDKKFWNEAERRFHAPNILKEFQQAIRQNTIDLYSANDTHVSTTGYIILGNVIYNNIGEFKSENKF